MHDQAPIAAGLHTSRGRNTPGSLELTRAGRSPWRPVTWLIGFICLLVILVPLSWIYWMAAVVQGTELNCTTWQVRSFHFLRDPFTDTQLTAIRHDTRGQFALDAVIATYAVPAADQATLATVVRWDLVAIRQGMRSGNGEAQVLLKYLEATDPDRENIWANWTKKHPEMARIFWPAVRDTVLLERYDCLPEIFDTVRLQKDPAALKNALVSRIRGLLAEQSALPQAAKDHSSAKLLQQLELSYGVSEIELSTRQNVEASK